MMKILAVIPARYNSQRFPGKLLELLSDKPVLQWVYEATASCQVIGSVIVATDSEKIAELVTGFGGTVEMTQSSHQTGTDRVAEVASRYPEMEVIVNVQGDQPFINSKMLIQLVKPYLEGEFPDMTTLACPLDLGKSYNDPNVVKVLCDQNNRAIYFSRSPIPYFKVSIKVPVYHHLGVYAFSQKFLQKYAFLKPTPFEKCESLEQLRALEHGYSIRVCKTETSVLEINTPQDLIKANFLVGISQICKC